MPELVVDEVCHSWPVPGGRLEILKGVSFRLKAGQNAAIIGPSGAGKSTLLHLIAGLDRTTSGRVTVDGVDPARLPPPAQAVFRSEKTGFIFQEHHLLPQLTALENVVLPVLATRRVQAADRARAAMLLEQVGLRERTGHLPGELSGGERQRVAVVRALINAPKLLLADEPTGALDRRSAEALAALLVELNREESVTLIVATHSPELAAHMSRRVELVEGRLIEHGAGT